MKQDTDKKKKKFVKEYVKAKFNISKTCNAIGIGRQTFYNWMKNDEKFSDSVVSAKEEQTDEIEDSLLKIARGYTTTETKTVVKKTAGNIQTITTTRDIHHPPNLGAIKLFLEAYARDRGYGMKQDDSDKDDFPDD